MDPLSVTLPSDSPALIASASNPFSPTKTCLTRSYSEESSFNLADLGAAPAVTFETSAQKTGKVFELGSPKTPRVTTDDSGSSLVERALKESSFPLLPLEGRFPAPSVSEKTVNNEKIRKAVNSYYTNQDPKKLSEFAQKAGMEHEEFKNLIQLLELCVAEITTSGELTPAKQRQMCLDNECSEELVVLLMPLVKKQSKELLPEEASSSSKRKRSVFPVDRSSTKRNPGRPLKYSN